MIMKPVHMLGILCLDPVKKTRSC